MVVIYNTYAGLFISGNFTLQTTTSCGQKNSLGGGNEFG